MFDVIHSVFQVPVSLAQVCHEQVSHQRFGVIVEPFGEMELSLENVLVNDHGIIIGKGINTSDHFINNDPERPPINRLAMALILQNFWGEILRRATKGKSSVLDHFSKTKISQLNVAIRRNEQVFRFEVSVDDIFAMEVLEDEDELGGVEGGFVGLEHAFFSEVGEELSAGNVFQEEVDGCGVLVHALEVDDKGMADRFENLVLVADMVDLLGFD